MHRKPYNVHAACCAQQTTVHQSDLTCTACAMRWWRALTARLGPLCVRQRTVPGWTISSTSTNVRVAAVPIGRLKLRAVPATPSKPHERAEPSGPAACLLRQRMLQQRLRAEALLCSCNAFLESRLHRTADSIGVRQRSVGTVRQVVAIHLGGAAAACAGSHGLTD
jgi:hypothetical protein